MRSHTKEKPFECTQCGRHFSRTYVVLHLRIIPAEPNRTDALESSDTLHRHELSHHAFGVDGEKDHVHRITVKTFRACFNCAMARVRCSGGIPCARCDNRTLGCDYPTARRSKARASKEALQKLSPTKEKDPGLRDSQLTATSRGRAGVWLAHDASESPTQPPAYQMAEFQLHLNAQNTPNALAQEPSCLNTLELAEKLPKGPRGAPRDVDTEQSSSQLPVSPYLGLSAQQACPNMPTSTVRSSLSPDPETGVTGQHFNSQPEMEDSNVDIEMATGENQQMQLGFDQSLLEQSMLSMNWLPSNLFPDTPENPPSLSGFALQPTFCQGEFLDGSLRPMAWPAPTINADRISPSLSEGISYTPPGSISLGTNVESPGQYSQTVSSQSEPHDPVSGSGDYYVDGTGSRLPKYRRRLRLLSRSSPNSADIRWQLRNELYPAAGFPLIEETGMCAISEKTFDHHVEPSTYDKIYSRFIQLCCTDNFVYQKFESNNFPSTRSLTSFIHAYFDSFQSVYPIFHSPKFDPNRCHWLVPLAVSAIGCHIASIPETELCTVAFHEFIRRAINVEVRIRLPC